MTKNDYKKLNYEIITEKIDDFYFSHYKDIPTIMGDGNTKEESIQDVKNAFDCFLDVALEHNDFIPMPEDNN